MPKVIGIENGSLSGSESLEKKDKRHVRRASLKFTYIVLADTLADSEEDILATSGIPPLFYPYRGYYCMKRDPKEVTRIVHPVTGVAAAEWHVDVEYRNDINPEDDQEPTSLPPTVRWSGETEEEPLEFDAISGDPIQTRAGEKIDVVHSVVRPVLEIRRYENYPFDPDVMLSYANKINDEEFWGAPEGSALMMPMDVDEETIEGQKYAVVTYRIKFKISEKEIPYGLRLLHYGTQYIDAFGDVARNEDKYGRVYPTSLDVLGGKLPDGDPEVFLFFNRFQRVDFNLLSLGPF